MKKPTFTKKFLLQYVDNFEEVIDYYLSRLPESLKVIYPKIINKEPFPPEDATEHIYMCLNFIKAISVSQNLNFDYISAYSDFVLDLEQKGNPQGNNLFLFRRFCLEQKNKDTYTYETLEKKE